MYCMICKENSAGGDGLCVKCRFKMKQQNRDVAADMEIDLPEGHFVGKARNGIPDGRGELTYNEHDSRKSYKGDFKNGMRHGKGRLTFRNEAYYDGEWVNDKYEGYGEEVLPGDNIFDGYFSAGAFTNGHVYFGDGREYDGEWSDDKPNGNGKMFFRDGHSLEGYWVNGICAFSEAPTEDQIAAFLAEQESSLADNPIEEERESMIRRQNTSELPNEDLSNRIWNPLAKEEIEAAEEDEGSPLLFEGMPQSANVSKITSQRAEPVNISHARTVFRGNGFDGSEMLDLEDAADVLAKRMAESAAHSLAAYDESVADVDLSGGEAAETKEAAAATEGVQETSEAAEQGVDTMIESSFVETTEDERTPDANSKLLQGMYNSIGKPIPEEEREKPVVKQVVDEKTLEDRAMQEYFKKLGVVPPAAAAEAPAETASAETAEAAASVETASEAALAETAAPAEDRSYDPVTKTGYHTETYANGERYEGYFVNGKRQGVGRMEYANGDVYEGAYEMGKRHGQGIMTYAAGSRYEGNWENSIKSGQGRFVQVNGEVYEGNFEGGTFDGFGSYTFSNGNIYMGEWKAGKRDGKGVLIHPDGSKEAQIWEGGKKVFSEVVAEVVTVAEETAAAVEQAAEAASEAAATVAEAAETAVTAAENAAETAAEAATTAAESAEAATEAAAEDAAPAEEAVPEREIRTINYKSGNRYEGEVDEKSLPNGKGVFTYTNGSYYEGEFEHGVRNGEGTFVWSTGDRYEGGWKADKRHGEGVMTYANGRVRKGRFENNEYVGI